MTNIGRRIRRTREEKGITQDLMALELNITQSNYGRLEKDDKRLNVPKLMKISRVLNVSVANLFNEQTNRVIHQQNNENPIAYNVETIHQDNKEIYNKLISSLEKQNLTLEKEVEHLQEQNIKLMDLASK